MTTEPTPEETQLSVQSMFADIPGNHRDTYEWLVNVNPNLTGTQLLIAELFATFTVAFEKLPKGAEKSAGMRKLLEAKDCFVRASLPDDM